MSIQRSMIHRIILLAAIIGWFSSVSAWAAGSKVCESKIDFKVAAPNVAWLTCDGGLRGIEGDGTLFDVSSRDDDPTAAAVAIAGTVTSRLLAGKVLNYSEVDFPSNLQANKSYVLKIAAANISKVMPAEIHPGAEGWAPIFVSFSTKASSVLTPSKDPLELGTTFVLTADMGLAACPQQKPALQEIQAALKPKPHDAILMKSSTNMPGENDTATASCELPVIDPETRRPQFNPRYIGQAFLTLPGDDKFYQAKAQLNVTGVKDVFGQEISIPKDKQKIALKDLPKGKDDSAFYLQFSNQAGPGAKPTWALDAKGAPVFGGEVAGFSPTLNLLANVGYGNVQSPNTIDWGGGLTRLFKTGNSTLQAVRFSPTVALETDRTFASERNIVVSPDFRFYLPFLNEKRDLRSRRSFVSAIDKKSEAEISKIDADDPRFKKQWGFFTQLWMGMEAGGALISPTFVTPDKTSSVSVPSYGILRFHPKLQTNLEVWRFTVDLNLTSRYVADTEYVGRFFPVVNSVTGAKSSVAYVQAIQGWRGYGELSFSFALDQASHINLTSTYKRGSAAPAFNKVDVVQSGITLKY
jgi:hypothetical protein